MNVNGRYIMAHVATWCKLRTTPIHGSHVLLLVLDSFFMIYGFIFCCIGGYVVIVGNNSYESLIHCLCLIVEGLNHSMPMAICVLLAASLSDFEILNLFFNKYVLDLCSFLLQHYTCGIDSINRFPHNLTPFLCCFCHPFMSKRVFFFTHVLPLDFPFHVFGMFECLLIEVGVGEFVGGLIFGDTSSWPDNGMVVLFDSGIIASWQMDNVEVGLMGRVVVALNSMGFCINSM